MSTLFCDLKDLHNESDVEQKFITPLLKTEKPIGLGYLNSDYKTKSDVRKITIDKGNSKKLYFPDYIVILNGYPLMLLEGKAPGEDLEEAFREGRLYATEINAKFPTGVNPCRKIIVTDGKNTHAGNWNQAKPIHILSFDEMSIALEKYSNFIQFACRETLQAFTDLILEIYRKGRQFRRPNQWKV